MKLNIFFIGLSAAAFSQASIAAADCSSELTLLAKSKDASERHFRTLLDTCNSEKEAASKKSAEHIKYYSDVIASLSRQIEQQDRK